MQEQVQELVQGSERERRDRAGAPRTAKAGFAELVLICAKCAERQGVGAKRLRRALKRALREEGGRKIRRKIRIVETGCLGPCPRRMLALATPASLARRRVILVEPALDALGPEALRLDPLSPPLSPPLAPQLAPGAGRDA